MSIADSGTSYAASGSKSSKFAVGRKLIATSEMSDWPKHVSREEFDWTVANASASSTTSSTSFQGMDADTLQRMITRTHRLLPGEDKRQGTFVFKSAEAARVKVLLDSLLSWYGENENCRPTKFVHLEIGKSFSPEDSSTLARKISELLVTEGRRVVSIDVSKSKYVFTSAAFKHTFIPSSNAMLIMENVTLLFTVCDKALAQIDANSPWFPFIVDVDVATKSDDNEAEEGLKSLSKQVYQLMVSNEYKIPQMKTLLAKLPTLKSEADTNRTFLHLASVRGQDDLVSPLLPMLPQAVKQCDRNGDTPLSLAVRYEQVSTLKELLQRGKSVDVTEALRLKIPFSLEKSAEAVPQVHILELALQRFNSGAFSSLELLLQQVTKTNPLEWDAALKESFASLGSCPLHWIMKSDIRPALEFWLGFRKIDVTNWTEMDIQKVILWVSENRRVDLAAQYLRELLERGAPITMKHVPALSAALQPEVANWLIQKQQHQAAHAALAKSVAQSLSTKCILPTKDSFESGAQVHVGVCMETISAGLELRLSQEFSDTILTSLRDAADAPFPHNHLARMLDHAFRPLLGVMPLKSVSKSTKKHIVDKLKKMEFKVANGSLVYKKTGDGEELLNNIVAKCMSTAEQFYNFTLQEYRARSMTYLLLDSLSEKEDFRKLLTGDNKKGVQQEKVRDSVLESLRELTNEMQDLQLMFRTETIGKAVSSVDLPTDVQRYYGEEITFSLKHDAASCIGLRCKAAFNKCLAPASVVSIPTEGGLSVNDKLQSRRKAEQILEAVFNGFVVNSENSHALGVCKSLMLSALMNRDDLVEYNGSPGPLKQQLEILIAKLKDVLKAFQKIEQLITPSNSAATCNAFQSQIRTAIVGWAPDWIKCLASTQGPTPSALTFHWVRPTAFSTQTAEQSEFVEEFMCKFDRLYSVLTALTDESVMRKESASVASLKAGAEMVEGMFKFKLFGVELDFGKITSGLITLGIYIDQKVEKQAAARLLSVFAAESPLDRIHALDAFARRIAHQYRHVLSRLRCGGDNSGPRLFARCVVNRAVKYITQRDANAIKQEDSIFTAWWHKWQKGATIPTTYKPLSFLLQQGMRQAKDENDADRGKIKLNHQFFEGPADAAPQWNVAVLIDNIGWKWPHDGSRAFFDVKGGAELIQHLGYREATPDEKKPDKMLDVNDWINDKKHSAEEREQLRTQLLTH